MSHKSTDVKTPGIVAIAKKWKLPVAKVMELVNQGAEVEKEHNKSIVKARQVARDHINERPDYYNKLKKMEKTPISVKEETGISGVRGLGYVTGDPGVDYIQNYIDTNAMAYEDDNGSHFELIKKKHLEHHNSKLGFNFFDPTDGNASNKTLKEAKHPLQVNFDKYRKGKLNELGGNVGYEGLTDAAPKGRRNVDLEEGPKLDKAKKIAKTAAITGMTAANMYTMGDAISQHKPRHQTDMVRAATALPGAAGWGASAVHYGKKGYDLAKAALKKKKQMEEDAVNEDLRKWFREKWVRYDTKGNIKGPCAREEGEGKPKCRPLASARAMSKDERAKSARRKRREDPVADRPGKGGKPIMVNTNEETLLEKNVPTNPALWARAKAQAKAKFDVYPSAYANGWASKWYKSKGGGWKSAANESVDEACWDNYKQKGMKKKGNKMVPNCVPVEEQGSSATPYTERPTYESAAWQRKEGKNPEGGLNRKGIASYRRENPGSKLSMAVTTKPSKLDPDSKPAKRRKSFCARMGGMPGPMKDEKGRPTRKALSLRKWNCEEENKYPQTAERGIYEGDDTPKKEVVYTHKKGPLYGTVTQHSDGRFSTHRKIGMSWKTAMHKTKEGAIGHLENDGNLKKLKFKLKKEQINEKAPPGAKYERMVRHIKDRLGADGLTDKEKGIAFATAWKAYNRKHMKEESDAADETNMAKTQLKAMAAKASNLDSKLKSAKNLPGWVQSKIAVAKDGITAVDDYMTHSDQINEISDTLVGRASNAAFWKGKAPSERLTRYIVRAQTRDPKKKEEPKKKQVKENMHGKDWDIATGKLPEQTYFHPTHKHTARLSKEKAMKPDNIIEPGGVKGHVSSDMHTEQTKETTMDNQNLINEALENILENNLNDMKENLLEAINEKAMEKLEERKKAIAADYFAQ